MAIGRTAGIVILAALALSLVQGALGLPVLVTKCGVISAPGEYYLITDITGSTAAACIEITSSDVLFDGNGHTIDGRDTASSRGIWVHGTSRLTNVVVSDVAVTRWHTGIYAYNTRGTRIGDVRAEDNQVGISLASTEDSRIENTVVRNNHIEEVYLYASSNNMIINNRIESPLTPGSLGILVTLSSENRITNNYINNSRGIIATFANTWNTTRNPGPNIIGGPTLGGNFWATPAGTGYSETCTDADNDGFCDAAFALNANNTDHLPLKDYYKVTGCRQLILPGKYSLRNDILDSTAPVCIEITGSDILFDGHGHTIDGIGSGASFGVAVYNLSRRLARVGLTGLTVQEWGDGVRIQRVSDSNVTWSVSRNNARDGIYLLETSEIVVTDTTITGNTAAGAGVISSGGAIFLRNRIAEHRSGSHTDYGIILTNSTGSTIADNNISWNSNMGLILWSTTGSVVRNNTVFRNGNAGILLTSSDTFPSAASGNTITANNITGNGNFGISLRQASTGNDITKNTIRDTLLHGISIGDSSTKNQLQHNIIAGNGGAGIIITEAGGNLIADNYFNNTDNIQNWTVSENTWNTTKQAGQNIVGGPFLGGNYWAQPDGLGFSETCTDNNGDGICDIPFVYDPQNADYLPLRTVGPVNGCTVIAQPGTYELTADILNSNAVSCIRISSSDVIFNGNGHTVDGIGAGGSRGVSVYQDFKTLTNVTISDLVLTNWEQGIFVDRTTQSHLTGNVVVKNHQGIETDTVSDSTVAKNTVLDNTGHGIILHSSCRNNSITGNTVSNNDFSGIYLHEHSTGNEVSENTADNNGENGIFVQVMSNRNTIRRNFFRGNAGSGIYVWGSSENLIADNAFNNSVNVKLREITANTWNMSLHPAKNILGGPVSGGNSWAQPDGLGFSQTCTDANHDGICDNGNSFDAGNTDKLPLVAFTLLPFPGSTRLPTDPDNDGIYEDCNGNGRLDFADVVLYFNQMSWVAANEPIFLFDLNHNGRIDFADIVALFNEI